MWMPFTGSLAGPVCLVTFILTVAMWFVAIRPGPVKGAPLSIVSLQIAFTAKRAQKVVAAWSAVKEIDAVADARRGVWWDFVYLFVYSTFIGTGCQWAAALALDKGWPGLAAWTATHAAWMATAAAAFDATEDGVTLAYLYGNPEPSLPPILSTCATIKWALIIVSAGSGLVALWRGLGY